MTFYIVDRLTFYMYIPCKSKKRFIEEVNVTSFDWPIFICTLYSAGLTVKVLYSYMNLNIDPIIVSLCFTFISFKSVSVRVLFW